MHSITISLDFQGNFPVFYSRLLVLMFSKGLLLIALQRLSYLKINTQLPGGIGPVTGCVLLLGKYLVQVITKSDILPSTTFEPGVYLSNHGHIILGANKIGSGTVIHHCVTIGMNLENEGIPTIDRNVWIGPHCVIYGNIHVGEGATVLPYTVLTKSIPAGVVVRGNPARIVARDFDNTALRSTTGTEISSLNLKDCDVHSCPG